MTQSWGGGLNLTLCNFQKSGGGEGLKCKFKVQLGQDHFLKTNLKELPLYEWEVSNGEMSKGEMSKATVSFAHTSLIE